MHQQKQQPQLNQHQPKRLQDEVIWYDVYSESTPVSTKNIPIIQKINFNNCGRAHEEGNIVQNHNGSFVAQGNLKIAKKIIPQQPNLTSNKKHQLQNKSQKRESSTNSDKINNSLLKLKSRNRCNDNLSLATGADNNISRPIYPGILDNFNQTVKPKLSEQQQFQLSQMTQNRIAGISQQAERETRKSSKAQKLIMNDGTVSSINSLERKQNGEQKVLTSMKDLKKIILSSEPTSCQNKVQKEKLMLLKNLQPQQKSSNSQVATPKYLKFKQKTQSFKAAVRPQPQSNYQSNSHINEDYGQVTLQLDNSYTISPLEIKKTQSFLQNKISMKTSSQKERDTNNVSAITQEKSSFIFSHEKIKKNKSHEEDREEMSTTINCTSNNDPSLYPLDEQCSPKNMTYVFNSTQRHALQIQNIINASANSKKLSSNKRRTEDPSSPNNLISNCNKSFQYGHTTTNYVPNGRGGSNGGSGPRQTKSQRNRSGGSGAQSAHQTSFKQENPVQPKKKFVFGVSNLSKAQKSVKPKGSCKSSRSNSVKKDLKKVRGIKDPQKQQLVNNYMCMTDYEEQPPQQLHDTKQFSIFQNTAQIPHHAFDTNFTQQTTENPQQFQYETFNIVNNNKVVENKQVELNFQNIQEIETMKRELRNKDILIQNLRERLQNLEDKVNGIQKEEQRDKSQQRIKEAIHSLEEKLEQFRFERDLNNKKLEEIKMYSSIQSSSRQSHFRPQHQASQNSILDDLESLITITDGDDFLAKKSIRTPIFEQQCCDDLNIIAQDGDLMSDGQQDNSCLMMLEKEWQEQQRQMNDVLDHSQIQTNNVFFLEDDTTLEEDDIHQAALKEKFVKTQKIELKEAQKEHRNQSFSKTFSKTNLLTKIRNAMGKKENNINRINLLEGGQRKTPRRFIVKRSQERGQQPNKITIISQQPQKLQEQQEELLKNMMVKKEKIAKTQKDAIKKERDLSVKLRQAIQKLNFKIQMQSKPQINKE